MLTLEDMRMEPMKHSHSMLASCAIVWLAFFTATAYPMQRDTELAQSVLDKVVAARQTVKNFRCTVTYHDFRPNAGRSRRPELGEGEQRLHDAMIQELLATEHAFQEHNLAFDNKGRARVEMLAGTADPNGNLASLDSKSISTWDGENSVHYVHPWHGRYGSASIGGKQSFLTTKRHRQPWHQFGGAFAESYGRALEQGGTIDIMTCEDGRYRVAIMHDDDSSEVGVIDPAQGYSVSVHEQYRKGRLIQQHTATFKQVSPGIWFPVEGSSVRFAVENPSQLQVHTTVRISKVAINDPNFYDDLFDVDIPKGAVILDQTSGLRYTLGEPMSQSPRGISDARSLHEIAMGALEDIAGEAELFLPKAGLAIEKGVPFVAHLSDHTFVDPRARPDSERAYRHLMELGKGDLAWDGRLLAMRDAVLLTTQQESKRPLTHIKGKWAQIYELPRKARLPYWTVVVTKEGDSYLLSVREIRNDGMRVACRKLGSDELSLHIGKSKATRETP